MKKIFSFILILSITTAALFAGGNQQKGSTTPANPDQPYAGTTLKLLITRFPPVESWMEYAERAAKEMGIKLEAQWLTADGVSNKILLDNQAGVDTWDIVYVNELDLPTFTAQGAIYPINSFLENKKLVDPNLDLNDIVYMEGVTSDGSMGPKGTIWGFPWLYTGPVLSYRTDIFNDPSEQQAFRAKYGYALKVPETYDQFKDVAEFFTRKKGEKLCGVTLTEDFYGTSHSGKPTFFLWNDFVNYMEAFGGQLYDKKTMQPTWNSPNVVRSVKYLKSLVPYMPSNWNVLSSGESTAYFVSGKVAMILEYEDRVISMANDEKSSKIMGKWDYAVMPSVPNMGRDHATLLSLNVMGIYGRSKNKEAAYKLMERLNDPAIQKEKLLKYGQTPTMKSIMEDKAYVQSLPPYLQKSTIFTGSGVHLFVFDRLPEYSEIVDIVGTSLSEALTASANVEDSMNKGQEKLVALFKRAKYIP